MTSLKLLPATPATTFSPKALPPLPPPAFCVKLNSAAKKERQRLLAELQEAEGRKVALKTVGKLIIRKQVGEENQIFGTVTTQDIADAIKERAGQEVDRRGITLPEIGKTGTYEAQVKLHPEVTATVQFDVISL